MQRTTLYFYQDEQFKLGLQGTHSRTLLNGPSYSLAERLGTATVDETRLLTTDKHGSVLRVQAGQDATSCVYTAYGHDLIQDGEPPCAGFNGERRDRFTGSYLLGQGYRAFSPVLMRFHSPDSFSPFDEGGINAYVYCSGDPVNAIDPTGHITVKPKPITKSSVNVSTLKPRAPTGKRPKVRFDLEKTRHIPHRPPSDVSPNGVLAQLNASEKPALKLTNHNPRGGRALFNDRRNYYLYFARLEGEYIQLNKIAQRRALAHEYLTNDAIQLSAGIEGVRLKAYDSLDKQFKDARKHFLDKLNALRQPG